MFGLRCLLCQIITGATALCSRQTLRSRQVFCESGTCHSCLLGNVPNVLVNHLDPIHFLPATCTWSVYIHCLKSIHVHGPYISIALNRFSLNHATQLGTRICWSSLFAWYLILFSTVFSRHMITNAKRQLKLEWRYLQRDAGFYAIALGLLWWTAYDSLLTTLELSVLIGAYAVYCITCAYTGTLARYFCNESRKPRRRRPLGELMRQVNRSQSQVWPWL